MFNEPMNSCTKRIRTRNNTTFNRINETNEKSLFNIGNTYMQNKSFKRIQLLNINKSNHHSRNNKAGNRKYPVDINNKINKRSIDLSLNEETGLISYKTDKTSPSNFGNSYISFDTSDEIKSKDTSGFQLSYERVTISPKPTLHEEEKEIISNVDSRSIFQKKNESYGHNYTLKSISQSIKGGDKKVSLKKGNTKRIKSVPASSFDNVCQYSNQNLLSKLSSIYMLIERDETSIQSKNFLHKSGKDNINSNKYNKWHTFQFYYWLVNRYINFITTSLSI